MYLTERRKIGRATNLRWKVSVVYTMLYKQAAHTAGKIIQVMQQGTDTQTYDLSDNSGINVTASKGTSRRCHDTNSTQSMVATASIATRIYFHTFTVPYQTDRLTPFTWKFFQKGLARPLLDAKPLKVVLTETERGIYRNSWVVCRSFCLLRRY